MRKRRRIVVEPRKPIIDEDPLEVYLKGGKLMVSLERQGLRDEEFGVVAEMCGAAGVALLDDEGFVLDYVAGKADGLTPNSKVTEIKFLSAFEVDVYEKVEAELEEAGRQESAIILDLEQYFGRVDRCKEEGGYIREISESLLYSDGGRPTPTERWDSVEELLIGCLELRERIAREAAERQKQPTLWGRISSFLFGNDHSTSDAKSIRPVAY